MRLTGGQLFILQWIAGTTGGRVAKSARVPHEAPGSVGMQQARGLITRGFLTEEGPLKMFVRITDAGRELTKKYQHCSACSAAVRIRRGRERFLEKHKCEHGLWCTPGGVSPDTREIEYPAFGDRSRDCEKCNVITSKMREGCYGLRQHGGSTR